MKERGELLIVEGCNRVGKTTLVAAIVERLRHGGVCVEALAFPGRSPGTIGRFVHRLHNHPLDVGIPTVSASALQTLHVAAHLDAIERVILPAVEAGTHVVLDRFWWSTLAYGRMAGVPEDVLTRLLELENAAWRETRPVLAILLDRTVMDDGPRDAARPFLREQYETLVQTERSRYPTAVLPNDGSLEETIADLIGLLAASGSRMALSRGRLDRS